MQVLFSVALTEKSFTLHRVRQAQNSDWHYLPCFQSYVAHRLSVVSGGDDLGKSFRCIAADIAPGVEFYRGSDACLKQVDSPAPFRL